MTFEVGGTETGTESCSAKKGIIRSLKSAYSGNFHYFTFKIHDCDSEVNFMTTHFSQFRDRSQTLVGVADAKSGVLKIFDPCKGALKKVPQILQ